MLGLLEWATKVMKMEEILSKEEVDKLWKWIDRPLPPDFFTEKLSDGQIQERIDEIPIQYRKLAKLIYELALWHHKLGRDSITPYSCCEFRQLLFVLVKKSKDSYPLPYYWFVDGIMVEPEWIVRLTNGLVKWVCDSSKSTCGLYGTCRFSA
jgi:hypothetical protein